MQWIRPWSTFPPSAATVQLQHLDRDVNADEKDVAGAGTLTAFQLNSIWKPASPFFSRVAAGFFQPRLGAGTLTTV